MAEAVASRQATGYQGRFLGLGSDAWHILGVIMPGVLWIVVFLVVPMLLLVGIAFMTNGPYGLPEQPFTLDAFRQLAGFGLLGWGPGNLLVILRTLWQTALATLLVTLISYPVAYYVTTRPPALQPILLLLVVAPSWSNQVIRAMGWMNLLAPGTPLSTLAAKLGLIAPELGLFPSAFAVTLGLVYDFLPFMVLPLYASFERLDHAQVEAAYDLHAGPVRAFLHAVLPQTLPGLLAGIMLVGIPAFGMYVVPELLGGGKSLMLGNLIARQFQDASNWPYGAAASIVMIAVTLVGLVVLRRLSRRAAGGVEVVL
ncbi:MAG: ABC transporter permease [Ottowia sp.]|nr:ABC transporter permease [Ottowia sp.]